MTSKLCLGIIFPQTFQHGNKSNSCLRPGGSHREQLLILQASEQLACNLPVAQGTNTELLLPPPAPAQPCALKASCPDRCSASCCVALSPAANHLSPCAPEDGLSLAWKLQTGSSLAKPAGSSALCGLNHTSSKGACILCRFVLPWRLPQPQETRQGFLIDYNYAFIVVVNSLY